MLQKIKVWGEEYLLVGGYDDGDKAGAIATPDQYYNFEPPYAHLFPDGTIKRYNKVIGSIKDVEFLGKVDE